MSVAAEKLHLSQPALSKAISKLEDELGVQLFDRVGGRLVLNERGSYFQENIGKILSSLDDCTASLRRFDEQCQESVSIAVCGPQREALACTRDFMKENPGVRVTFDVRHSDDARHSVWSSDIVYYPIGTVFSNSIGVPYADRKVCMVVPSSHPLARRGSVSLGQFADDSFVFLNRPYEFYGQCYRMCMDSGFSPMVRATSNSKPAILAFVDAGYGVSMLDGTKGFGGRYNVSVLRLEQDVPVKTLCIACRYPDRMSSAGRRYADFAFDYFKVPESQRPLAYFG